MQHATLSLLAALACAGPARAQLYATEFDDDAGWSFDPAPAPGLATWNVDDCGGPIFSAPASLNFTDETCVYDTLDHVFGTATGPEIDLSAASQPLLVFWCAFQTPETTCFFDVRHVQVSDDDFATTLLGHCFDDAQCPLLVLHQHAIPLDASWGKVRLRFWFDTIDNHVNWGFGWSVDDLAVVDDDPAYPLNYCPSDENSEHGAYGAAMSFSGSTSLAANDLRLEATRCPANQLSLFLMSQGQNEFPAGNGTFCLGGPFFRVYPASPTGPAGSPTRTLDLTMPPPGAPPIVAGATWYFQNWYRDPPAGGALYDFSDGLAVTFAP